MVGLRDSAKILENTVELNQKILSVQTALANAQAEQATLVQTISKLKKELARFETWKAEKHRYKLTEVASGVFTYVLQPETAAGEPSHWICASCYQKGKKSIPQGFNSTTFGWRHECPACKLKIETGFRSQNRRSRTRPIRLAPQRENSPGTTLTVPDCWTFPTRCCGPAI
jgi:hypothetical protein